MAPSSAGRACEDIGLAQRPAAAAAPLPQSGWRLPRRCAGLASQCVPAGVRASSVPRARWPEGAVRTGHPGVLSPELAPPAGAAPGTPPTAPSRSLSSQSLTLLLYFVLENSHLYPEHPSPRPSLQRARRPVLKPPVAPSGAGASRSARCAFSAPPPGSPPAPQGDTVLCARVPRALSLTRGWPSAPEFVCQLPEARSSAAPPPPGAWWHPAGGGHPGH